MNNNRWTEKNIPDQEGKIAIVTGSSSGIGFEAARALADNNAESGDYFGPDGWLQWRGYPVKVETNSLAKDKSIAKQLWDVSEKLTGIKFGLN